MRLVKTKIMTVLHFQGTFDVFSAINDDSIIFQGTVGVFSAINDDSTIFPGYCWYV